MGSKGSSPRTTQSTQTSTPNPYIAGAGQQAIQGAEYAAELPFQMPTAPLAPFSPFQNQAFQGIQQAQGMAQPYFGMGSQYLMGSADPVTGQDVSGYYNPMASNVMAGLQDVFGQQMSEATRNAVQKAGGVGADRIAVAQANLAKQQGLAAGQTLAGLYYPALQAAQQQKQMMAGAGYGLGQMGPAAQTAQLQSLQAMLGAGGMQQQLAQQYLNSLYQNRLAEVGYPMQTAQYLAGITGSLAPAMGGTTQGQQQTWAPQPSALSQALGIGTSLLGLGMAPFTGGTSLFGMMGSGLGSLGKGATGMSPYMPFGGGSAGALYKRGGRVGFEPAHMKGGGSPPPLPPPPAPIYKPAPIGRSAAGSESIPYGGVSTETALSEADPFFEWYGGVPAVNRAQISRLTTPEASRPSFTPKPYVPAPMGAMSLPRQKDLFKDWMDQQQEQIRTARNESYPGEGQYIYAQGGSVFPDSAGQGFQLGGGLGGSPKGSALGDPGQAFNVSEAKSANMPLGGMPGAVNPVMPDATGGSAAATDNQPGGLTIIPPPLPHPTPAIGDIASTALGGSRNPMAALPHQTAPHLNFQAYASLINQLFPQLQGMLPQLQGLQQKGSGMPHPHMSRFGHLFGNRNPSQVMGTAARGGRIRGYQEGGPAWGIEDFPFTPPEPPPPPMSDAPAPDFGGYATPQEQEMAQRGIEATQQQAEAPIAQPTVGGFEGVPPEVTPPPMGAGEDEAQRATAPMAAPPTPDYATQPPLEAGYSDALTQAPMPRVRPAEAAVSDPSAPLPAVYKGIHETLSQRWGSQAASAALGNLGVETPNLNTRQSHDQGTGIGIAGWRLDRREALYDFAESQGRDPMDRRTQVDFLMHEVENDPKYADMLKRMQEAPNAAVATRIFRTEYERPAGTTQGRPLGLGEAQRLALGFESGDFSRVGTGAPGEGTTTVSARERGPMGAGRVEDYMMPREQAPYPDALKRDWGQNLVRSPWMSLIKAGAAMASTPGPIGSVIGKGIEAGVGALEGERKELRSEQDINMKADRLWQEAKQHLDKYTKMTPYEQARLEQERYQWQPGMGTDPDTGAKVAGAWRLPTRSGEQPTFIPGAQITGKGGTRETALERNINYLVQHKIVPSEEDAFKVLHHSLQDQATFQRLVQNEQKFLADRPENAGKPASAIRAMAEENIRQAQRDSTMRVPTAPSPSGEHAGTSADPIPYKEGMKRKSGLVYIVPGQAQPQRWTGPNE